jgi:hypothetical protein
MPRRYPALIRVGLLGAAVLASAACTHVADVLTNTGAALRRHSDQGNDATQGSSGATQGATQNSGGATKAQFEAISDSYKASREECKATLATPELDPIRHKVELWREPGDDPLPFEIATNDTFPTSDDKSVIARWAALRDECNRRMDALTYIPPGANETQTAMVNTLRSLRQQATSNVTDLMICLYQQKLTYAEFGRKIYEFGKVVGAFNLALKQAGASSTISQQQIADLQAAQQQLTDAIDAFSKYIRTVSARKPKTVHQKAAGT